jgi:hypothetical protein
MGPCSHDTGTPPPLGFCVHRENAGQRKEKAMIARFDHRPMLTALLALSTTVLLVVVITLGTLLITAAPPAATSSGEGGGANPGAAAAVPGTGEFYGEGWNNYGHDTPLPQPGQAGDSAERQEVGHP